MRLSGVADLLLVGLLAAGGMVSAMTPSLDPATRFVFALLLVCVLPGYGATALLFHERSLGVAERAVLSLGLSLAIAALAGPVLNLTSWGLTPATWALFLGESTIAMSGIALIRRLRVRPRPLLPPMAWGRPGARSVVPMMLLSASLAITVAAVAVAQAGVRDQPRDPFTELWLVPGATVDEVVVGIRNFEDTQLRGRLVVTAGTATLAEFPDIDLVQEATWEQTVRFTDAATTDPIIASFYRAEAPDDVFRLVRLWRT